MSALCLALSFAASLQPEKDDFAKLPRSAPPSMAVVHAVDKEKGTVELVRVVQKAVPATQERQVVVLIDGKPETRTETITVMKTVSEMSIQRWSSASGRAYAGSDKLLAGDELWKRIKKGDTVLVGIGAEVDPAWLKPLKPDAVILLTDETAAVPSTPAPAPGPAPFPSPKRSQDRAAPAAFQARKPSTLSVFEQNVLDLANAERKQAGVALLKASILLTKAARQHSENMAAKETLSHELDGKGPAERLTALGYGWSAVAENAAHGQDGPEGAVKSWMESEGHKANLLNAAYTEAGVGIARGSDGQLWWTVVFAAPR